MISFVLQAFTGMYSPVPNGEQPAGGMECEGGSANFDYANDSEDNSHDFDDSEEVESPSRTVRRTKVTKTLALARARPRRRVSGTPSTQERPLLIRLRRLRHSSRLPQRSLGRPYPGSRSPCPLLQRENLLHLSFLHCCGSSLFF